MSQIISKRIVSWFLERVGIFILATFHKLYVINKLNLSVNVRIHLCYKWLESFMTWNDLFLHHCINYTTTNCDILLAIIIHQVLAKESKITILTYFCDVCDVTHCCWHLVDVGQFYVISLFFDRYNEIYYFN